MRMILQTADVVSDEKNCSYPNRVEVTSAEELEAAVRWDHVCAEYEGNYRSIRNFKRSNVVVMDCDNDHSEDPAEWITPERLDDLMPDVSYAIAFSRHNMLPKDGRSARPRFHVYFEVDEITDADRYAALKRGIRKEFPFFDDNALDAARFIYGADSGECIWHEGWDAVDAFVEPLYDRDSPGPDPSAAAGDEGRVDGMILQGHRNRTLSHFAGRALKRFGESDQALQLFRREAARCDPPLQEEELNTIWNSALKFYRNKVSRQDGYVSPEEYNAEFQTGTLKPADYSDLGQARVLAVEYGDELRYSDATDYLRYDGESWVEDRQLAVGAMEEFLDLQLADAQECVAEGRQALLNAGVAEEAVNAGGKTLEKAVSGDDQMGALIRFLAAKQYLSFVMKRRDYKYMVSALNAAKPLLAVKVSDLDRDGHLLNTPRATYNLALGMDGEQPHDPCDLITKITSCSPSDEGRKLWMDALQLFFCGDRDLIDYVQVIVGMAAIGKVYQEHLIIAYGNGANGKSTFWNTIARVMGSYSGKLSAETLTTKCKHNVKPEMAELKGKRLIIASEMEEGMRLNTSVVKQLCSTDEVFAEKKYKAPFAFTPSHTIVLYTNHLPHVGANDDGIWRRLIVIPFHAKIEGESDIKNYADHLFEHAGGYVMKWIIEGAQKAIRMNFKTPLPKCVEEAITAYREDNDWLGQFLAERCDLGKDLTEKSGELYQNYRAYCMESGEYTRSTKDFYAALEKAGFIRKKARSGIMVYGLCLREGQDFLE